VSPILGWRDTRLKNLFTSVRNGVWGDDPDKDTDVFCARGTDFDRSGDRISDAKMPRRKVPEVVLRQHQLRRGDLVLEKSGGSEDQPVGSTALFDLRVRAVCSNFNARLQVDPAVDSRFVCYLMNSLYRQGFTRQFVKQTTGIQNLDADALLSQHCSIPLLDVQRRIADFLDAETARIDGLQCARDRQLAGLDELVASRISMLVSAKTDAPFVRLGYLAIIQSGITVDGKRDSGPDAVTLPYLRVANVQDGHLNLEAVTEITAPREIARSSLLKRGDVLMTEGGDLDKLGRGTVWNAEIESCLHQNHVFAVRPDQRKLMPEYLSLITRTAYARAYFESTGTKTTNLASTSSNKIRDFRIPLIGLTDQARVVHETASWLENIANVQAVLTLQRTLLAERRQALITAAVTGEITV
jgi:type I restriction enzyme S subunit